MAEPTVEDVAKLEAELAELRPLKDTSVKLQEEFRAKEEQWAKDKAQLEEAANPNWQKARERIKVLEEVAKAKGVKLDDQGNPVDETKINRDELIKEAEAKAATTVRQEFLSNRLDELLENFSTEDSNVVRHMYAKITAGEQVNMQNIRTYVSQAVAASGLNQTDRLGRVASIGGGSPRQIKEGEGMTDEQAQGVAGLMGIKVAAKKK